MHPRDQRFSEITYSRGVAKMSMKFFRQLANGVEDNLQNV